MASKGEARAWLVDLMGREEHPNKCIEWPFAVSESGYPRGSWRGKTRLLARAVCQEFHGRPDNKKMQAAHLTGVCHNKLCLNPRHLRWASAKENIADKWKDGTMPVDSDHRLAVELTVGDLAFIRQWADKVDQGDLAERYDVSRATISRINCGTGRWARLWPVS